MKDYSPKIKIIGDLLLNIIEQRKHLSNSTYFQPVRQDYAHGEIWVNGMSDIEKDQCWNYLESQTSDYAEQDFIRQLLAYHLPEPDYLPPHSTNTPIVQLLKWYSDKNSKHVSTARKELKKRYPYLDEPDQNAFRLALISSLSKTDQLLGLNYFLELSQLTTRDLNAIKELWNREETKSNEALWYAACKLMIRHSDTKFLLQHQKELCEIEEGKTNNRLYYYLCVKLVNKPEFKLRKDKLNIEDYYRLVAYHSLRFDKHEWEEDFYRTVANIDADLFPYQITIPKKDKELWGDQEKRWKSILEVSSIRHMLQYALQRDFDGALEELIYCHLVDAAIEIGCPPDSVLHDSCPESYQYLLEKR